MLILIYNKLNNIGSYKRAKVKFFKEMEYVILADILDDPDMTDALKIILQKFIVKNFSEHS